MGNGRAESGVADVYAAAQQWVDRALKADDSLFTPGEPIWSSRWLEEIRGRFLNRPDESGAGFYEKLQEQLAGSPQEVYQLMAEALYVHFLIVWQGAMGAATRESQVKQVLGWSNGNVLVPDRLIAGFTPGLAHPGQAFFNYRPFQVGFLIEFGALWKKQTPRQQESLLEDPWAFKQFLQFKPTSRLFEEHGGEGTYRVQREALLHLVFPDTFEAIVSINHKTLISQAFADLVTEPTEDVDQKLQQIRRGLVRKFGRDFDYYDGSIRQRWDPLARRRAWDEFIGLAQAHWNSGQVDPLENSYKVEIGRKLGQAREAVLNGENNWSDLAKGGLSGNLIYPIQLARLKDWVTEYPDKALQSLQAIWTRDEVSVSMRIRAFLEHLQPSVISGPGTRATVASQFLMGVDVYHYPPFRITLFNDTYDQVGYARPSKDADEAGLYEHALAFLDLFMEEALERGLELRHRLDAQSLVWMILKEDPPKEDDLSPEPVPAVGLPELAGELLLPLGFLEEIETLLKIKGQVIFQGPPGTGKTFVAQKLAERLAGSEDRVTLVQFHPSYAYEDFVQGFRPTLEGDRAGFALTDGPLLTAAERAREEPDAQHFLVIDEINRGNLAKVFGELYFLLEYRDKKMRLQYQAEGDEEFSLPKNLYIIGTMNTADRSIALVDLALRRRFYFVEFHPDDEPIKGLLRTWLQKNSPAVEWVADVIDRVNKKLEVDRHVAIGPSYFMGTDEEGRAVVRDEVSVRRVWEHSVIPYIQEHLFGNLDSMNEWDLDTLRRQTTSAPTQKGDSDQEDPAEDNAQD